MSVLRQAQDGRTLGAAFAAACVAFEGAPFRLHGRDPATGLDCVGLIACALARCGRRVETPEGYALRALSLAPLLGFAARNGFALVADGEATAAGDLLLLRPSAVQAHLAVALDRGGLVHAHAGLGRVVREAGPISFLIAARWRLIPKG